MKKIVLGAIFLIFLPFCVFAQGFYFDIGPTIGRADNYPLTIIDLSLKAGYGPVGNIPVYIVVETGYLHGLLCGSGIIYYPIRFIQLGSSLGLAWMPSESEHHMGFGWNVSAAIDLGRRNHGFLMGFRYFGAVNEFETSNMYSVFVKYAYRKKIPQQSIVTENKIDSPYHEFKNTIYVGTGTSLGGPMLGGNVFSRLYFRIISGFWGIGINAEYERMFNNKHSLSINVGSDPMFIPYPLYSAEIKYRWYPFSKRFFVGLGTGIWGNENYTWSISPTLGWKFNIGKKKRLAIMPSITDRFLIDESIARDGRPLIMLNFNLSIGYNF
ncbi:MAG: hypothetical protein LBI06_00855 [Treponema sp.]|jgi:hypothetical protein|nr:hypothetical protein [Treponema sp.]